MLDKTIRDTIVLMKRSLDDSQLSRLSEILADVAQVLFATMVVAPLVAGVDKRNAVVVLLGMMMSLGFWIPSIFLMKE